MKSKTVNVRISEKLRNKLKAEAAKRGITLQELVEEKLEYK
jgi:predicted HicB family RNase H-like nuclease